ncbi:prostaglandin E2 receptor EP4 subtype-like isoform X1 [Dreissena polymorpha]|uniref:Thromboxane A2 receptor n=1 Tax=Dreissena polymorpha TaxID=45954 RepID=A0A9D4BJ96_DREPO|nr:prostaglandin E2 receptor EP4 subtype-like isoform X1 [Dreissena polymorpha]KAH3696834.1 hypothetical protein DPMN_084314 [Dreissena polymorpha]
MFLAGVGGNILALVILYRRRNDVRTIKFYHLIKGLVWTDLLGILFTTPSVLASYFNHRQWVGGDVHCRLHGLVMACFGMATPFIICAMAFERFLALKCVFFYSSRCTSGIAKGCILAVWIFVFAYCILPFIGFGKFEKQYPGTWCFFDFHSSKIDEKVYGYIYASINLLLILLMITCNAHVVYTLARTRFKRRYTPNRRESAVMSHMALTEQEVLVSVSRHTEEAITGPGNPHDSVSVCTDVCIHHMLGTVHGAHHVHTYYWKTKPSSRPCCSTTSQFEPDPGSLALYIAKTFFVCRSKEEGYCIVQCGPLFLQAKQYTFSRFRTKRCQQA